MQKRQALRAQVTSHNRGKARSHNLLLGTAAIVAGSVAAAACGGGHSGSGVANLGTSPRTTTTTTSPAPAQGGGAAAPNDKEALAYSECMRAHGEPKFPDPVNGRIQLKFTKGPNGQSSGMNPTSPQFEAAVKACKPLAPKNTTTPGATNSMEAQMLKFASCMRSQGVPSFPDPTFTGNGGVIMQGGGFNPNSPAFQHAQAACRYLLPPGFQTSAG
jgi:hypothetical protein